MLQLSGRRFAVLLLQWNKEANDDARQRGMHARLQHRRPQHHAHQNINTRTSDVEDVQQGQHHNSHGRHAQRQNRQIAGVEERDNHDSAQIIDNRQRHQENFQCYRDAATEQG